MKNLLTLDLTNFIAFAIRCHSRSRPSFLRGFAVWVFPRWDSRATFFASTLLQFNGVYLIEMALVYSPEANGEFVNQTLAKTGAAIHPERRDKMQKA